MDIWKLSWHLFETSIYFVTIVMGVGFGLLDSASVLLVVPALVGYALIVHALQTGHLDELGHAVMWLWAAVLCISATLIIAGGLGLGSAFPPVVATLGEVALTVLLMAVLVGRYAHNVGQVHSPDAAPQST